MTSRLTVLCSICRQDARAAFSELLSENSLNVEVLFSVINSTIAPLQHSGPSGGTFFSPLSLFSKILLSNDFFLTFGIHKPFGTHFTMLTFSSVCSGAQALWISWSDTAGFHRTSTPSIPQHCVNKGTRMMTSKYRIKQNKEQLNEGNQQKTIKYLNFAIETPNTSFYQQTSKYLGFVLRYGLYKIKVLFMVVKIK